MQVSRPIVEADHSLSLKPPEYQGTMALTDFRRLFFEEVVCCFSRGFFLFFFRTEKIPVVVQGVVLTGKVSIAVVREAGKNPANCDCGFCSSSELRILNRMSSLRNLYFKMRRYLGFSHLRMCRPPPPPQF